MAFKYRYKPKRQFSIPVDFNPNYKLIAVVCVLIVLAVYFLLTAEIQQPAPTTTTTTEQLMITVYCIKDNCSPQQISAGAGALAQGCYRNQTECLLSTMSKEKLIVAAKDVRQKLVSLGYATLLNLTVKSIQVHATGNTTDDSNITATGWITVFEGEKTFDLLEYTDALAIIGENELDTGKYTQIRLYIDDAKIKIYDIARNISNKTYPMEIPSKVLKLVHPFTIESGKTTVLILDFDVPASVPSRESIAGIGMAYKLTPVVQINETKIEAGALPENSTII